MATKGLSKLKGEMVFNQDLTRLVDVMKGIAAAQYHIMEHKKTKLEKYSNALEELFQTYDFRRSRHPFIRMNHPRRLICLVTTDSGFLGGLNMKIVQAGLRQEQEGAHYAVMGERGANYLREFSRPFNAFPGINADETRYALVEKLIGFIFSAVLKSRFGSVILVYPRAISFTSQRVEVLNLIPCPIFFKNKSERVPTDQEQAKGIILESKPARVIEWLTMLWLRKRLIEVFEDSKLSEYGARTMHLEDSYQTLKKLDKQLKLQFFKARREKIDQSLRESFTAQLMCK